MDGKLKIPTCYYVNFFNEFDDILIKLGKPKTIKAGEYIKRAGEFFTHSHYIKSGFCKYYINSENGKTKTIGFMGPGAIFSLLVARERYVHEYYNLEQKAMTDMKVIEIEKNDIKELMMNNRDFHMRVTEFHIELISYYNYSMMNDKNVDSLMKICEFLIMYKTALIMMLSIYLRRNLATALVCAEQMYQLSLTS